MIATSRYIQEYTSSINTRNILYIDCQNPKKSVAVIHNSLYLPSSISAFFANLDVRTRIFVAFLLVSGYRHQLA